jgi:predicted ArsR family transcriptional regulator
VATTGSPSSAAGPTAGGDEPRGQERDDVGSDRGAAEPIDGPARPIDTAPRLDVLKALGDNTRYAIYLELARSPLPLATAEIAELLDLHVNTVRPHLERMRDVGLLEVDAETRGTVGRPQHRYSLSPDAPALGLEPSPWPTLARTLLEAAVAGGLDGSDLAEAGRRQGRADAARWPDDAEGLDSLIVEQAKLGFDPETVDHPAGATIGFAHCPFRELAEQHPELVCSLHHGLVDGFVGSFAGCRVERFHPLLDRTPCQVEVGTG